jgi:hypothetical protein
MQGCCIYRDNFNNPVILAYRETEYARVFITKYYEKKIFVGYLNLKKFIIEFPKDCIHILEKLPYNDNIAILLEKWKKLIFNKLNSLNLQ